MKIIEHHTGILFDESKPKPIQFWVVDGTVAFCYRLKMCRLSEQHVEYLAQCVGMSEEALRGLSDHGKIFNGYILPDDSDEFKELSRLYWRYGFNQE